MFKKIKNKLDKWPDIVLVENEKLVIESYNTEYTLRICKDGKSLDDTYVKSNKISIMLENGVYQFRLTNESIALRVSDKKNIKVIGISKSYSA